MEGLAGAQALGTERGATDIPRVADGGMTGSAVPVAATAIRRLAQEIFLATNRGFSGSGPVPFIAPTRKRRGDAGGSQSSSRPSFRCRSCERVSDSAPDRLALLFRTLPPRTAQTTSGMPATVRRCGSRADERRRIALMALEVRHQLTLPADDRL